MPQNPGLIFWFSIVGVCKRGAGSSSSRQGQLGQHPQRVVGVIENLV